MSYKAILLGILLLLAVPAVSSAQVFFTAKVSGKNYCNGVATKLKEILFFEFNGQNMLVATDQNFLNIIAEMQQFDLWFFPNTTTGFFTYTQDDVDSEGMFAATFNTNNFLLTTFTGKLNEIDLTTGCSQSITIKSAKPLVQ
jgi:Ni,Fe-hydrogenase I cytochrome b subunit